MGRRRSAPARRARRRSARARDGISLQDRALGEPGLMGRMTRGADGARREPREREPARAQGQEKTAGISAEFPLPPFATTTFAKWLENHEPLPEAGSRRHRRDLRDVLRATTTSRATAGQRRPRAREERLRGRAAASRCAAASRTSTAATSTPRRGRRATNVALAPRGDRARARRSSCPGPSCCYTIRKEYPELLGTADARRSPRTPST